jgi:hypothetical protein
MRTMMRVTMAVEAANKVIRDGSISKIMESALGDLKPEAAYFTSHGGKRTAYIFFDLKDPSHMPSVAEPFFMHFNAEVEMMPAMNQQDLQAGLERLAKKS